MTTKHNPERRAWKGRSYKAVGRNVREMSEAADASADEEAEGEPEAEHECEVCGHDHEIHECDQAFCANCHEIVDNCDCDNCDEISAEEHIKRQKVRP